MSKLLMVQISSIGSRRETQNTEQVKGKIRGRTFVKDKSVGTW